MIHYKTNYNSSLIGKKVRYKGGLEFENSGVPILVVKDKEYEIAFSPWHSSSEDDDSVYVLKNLVVLVNNEPYRNLSNNFFDVDALVYNIVREDMLKINNRVLIEYSDKEVRINKQKDDDTQ